MYNVSWYLLVQSSCIFLINVPIFHITWLDTFWTDLVYHVLLPHNKFPDTSLKRMMTFSLKLQDLNFYARPFYPKYYHVTHPQWLKQNTALAGVAQCIHQWTSNQRVAGSIPSHGTCLGHRPGPLVGHLQEATDQCFSHISVSLSLFLPLFPSL